MEIKAVIGLKNGKSYVKTIDNSVLMGKKIGEKIDGKLLDLPNSEFEIRGGADNAGFPMRQDISGDGRKKIRTGKSIGVKKIDKKDIIRKTVAGRRIGEKTAEVNLKIIKGDVEKLLKPEEAPKEEVKKEEPTAEQK